MPFYQKKPVVIVAHRVTPYSLQEVAEWCGGRVAFRSNTDAVGTVIEITTLEGVMTAQLDDYVIQGVQGEFYPCKPEIFTETYEAI